MAKLLIVDDEAPIRMLVQKYAAYEGHEVDEAADGREAVRLCRANSYDAVVMDIMMPELDGFSACREIRRFSDVPILMLSARGEEYDKINGFEFGADDYIVKPFSPRELMLRIEAILKRVSPQRAEKKEPPKEVYSFGGLVADVTARIVTVDGVRADLSPKEYDLLFYMMRNRNIALSREKLISDVWGYDFFGGDRTLDTHIKLLRKSISPYSHLIVTLRGVGYRFDEPERS
ncbi:MAG: response regulator transcription factor [Clostridia bacterium]|nr:response regulator transcription factor [Clostridia bacterium]